MADASALASQINAHIVRFDEALTRVLLCNGDAAAACPDWWREAERNWRRNTTASLAARLALHAQTWNEFLPQSNPSTLRSVMNTVKKTRKEWPVVAYYQPDFSCGADLRRTASDRNNNYAVRDDGGKWLCGWRAADFAPPCTVLSIGSNFDDAFERAMHKLASCRSLTFDPTLGPIGSQKVRSFAASLEQYGSRLNASVGLGFGAIADRTGTRHKLRPLAELLAGSGGFFRGATGGHHHLTVAKIDAEGGEFRGGLIGPDGLWEQCAAGRLTVDQVVVEVHLRMAGSLASLNAIFEGASRCGMVLLHKETNWLGCHFGGCVEFSWASLRHVRRVMERARAAT